MDNRSLPVITLSGRLNNAAMSLDQKYSVIVVCGLEFMQSRVGEDLP